MKKPTEAVRASPLSPALRRYLYLTAAMTGAGIMVIEILGAKMLSPYVGTSHFVWTAQITVTLLALATGYAVGGGLVDRSPKLGWIYGGIVLAASYLILAVLLVEKVAYACLRFPLSLGSLLCAMTLFFAPLALLAMVGPFFVRMLTANVNTVGSNVGRLSALSTLGSVVGTILIGYVVIPYAPNSVTMFLTAATLLTVGVTYFAVWQRRQVPPAATVAVLGLVAGSLGLFAQARAESGRLTQLYKGNSNFGMLQVLGSPSGGRRYYLNDWLTQNTYDTTSHRSTSLFTYMLHDLALAYRPAISNVLCIGVGVGIVPMRFAEDGARVDAVEINPSVIPLATKYFEFDASKINLTIGDGRTFLNRTQQTYDAIALDAFLGESPPSHLMTRESFQTMKSRLKEGGVLVMNTFGDFTAGKDFFPASLYQTMRQVFRSVRIHASGNGNVFFVASDRAQLLPLQTPDFASYPSELSDAGQAAFEGLMEPIAGHGMVLTDDYNPVDFHDAKNREELRRRLALSYQVD